MEMSGISKRIQALEAENASLKAENAILKTEIMTSKYVDLQIDLSAIDVQPIQNSSVKYKFSDFSDHYTKFINTLPDLFYIKDEEGRYMYANTAFGNFIDKSIEQIVDRNDFEIFDFELAKKLRDADKNSKTANHLVRNEETAIDSNGNKVVLETYRLPFKDSSGQVKGIIAFSRDITTRFVLEEDLKDKLGFHLTLMDNIPTPVYFKNVESRYIDCNKAFANIFQLPKQDIIGKTVYHLLSAQQAEEFESKDLELMLSRIPQVFEKTVRFPNNTEVVYLCHKSVFFDNFKQVAGVIGTLLDITVSKKAEEELLKYTEDLEAARAVQEDYSQNLAIMIEELEIAKSEAVNASKAKGEFLANISHEIRTPLNAIIGFSEILLNRVIEDSNRHYLKTIINSSRSLLALINDILDLSKIESGKIDLNLEPVFLDSIILEVGMIFSKTIEEKGVTLNFPERNVHPKLFLDEVRIRQILFNLIGNAIKFTDYGEVAIETIYEAIIDNSDSINLTLKISDTGIGIPRNEYERIFDDFVQRSGQNTKKYGGTGLGLAITKRLVEKMRGTISVESEEGKGSVFTICLPNIKVDNHYSNLIKQESNNIINPRFKSQLVLIVDNNELNREVIKGILDNRNLNTIESDLTDSLFENFKQNQPDLILIDVDNQNSDAYEIAKLIRTNDTMESSIIIAVTSSGLMNNQLDEYRMFDDFIYKPFDHNTVFITLTKYLEFDEQLYYKNNDAESCSEMDINLSEVQCNDLIAEMESALYNKWEYIQKYFIISKVVDFTKDLQDIALKYNCFGLIKYSKELHDYTTITDIRMIKIYLNKYPDILNKLRDYQRVNYGTK